MLSRLVILLNILFGLIGALGILLALTSPMLFDAPGSENNTYLWVTFWSALLLPLTCFGSVIASWCVYFRSKNYKLSLYLLLIPSVNIITLIGSLVLIQVFCQGDFSCH